MLNLIEYRGIRPKFAGEPIALPGHAVAGRVTVGLGAWLGAGSVIRGDGHFITIGDDLHLGRGATIHIAHDLYPTMIGNNVCIGTDAVVHACTVHDDVVVGSGSVILDGSVIGARCVLADDSIVYPRSTLEPCTLYAGRPAKPVQKLDTLSWQSLRRLQRENNLAASHGWACRPRAIKQSPSAFVAGTCDIAGIVSLEDCASIWFGSRLDATNGASITIGTCSNIQDNSVLYGGTVGITIGAKTTLGHNVHLSECTIGDRCLIGIGSNIAPRTVIEDDNFVAAGSTTEPGQRLRPGWFWAGRPAQKIAELDEVKRNVISKTAIAYHLYACDFDSVKSVATD